MEINKTQKVRESGIELLKLIAIIFIVLHHTAMSAIKSLPELPLYGVNSTLLKLIELLGPIGNVLFIVCSFWFLVDSMRVKASKVVTIILQSVVISLLWLSGLLIAGVEIDGFTIFKQFLPEIFQNLWFISVYLIFYIIHPLINWILGKIKKHGQFMLILGCVSLYIVLDILFIENTNYAMIFTITYLVIYYVKKYCRDVCDKISLNVVLSILGAIGLIGITLVKTFIFVSWEPSDSYRYLFWYQFIFALLFCIPMFNIFRSFKFKSKVINSLSSCSLLVYAIHENVLFRSTVRQQLFNSIVSEFGTKNIMWWVLLIFVCLAIAAFGIALLFKKTIQIPIDYVSKQSDKLVDNLIIKLSKKDKKEENS